MGLLQILRHTEAEGMAKPAVLGLHVHGGAAGMTTDRRRMRILTRMTRHQAEDILQWLRTYEAQQAEYGVREARYGAWCLARALGIRPINARRLVARAQELAAASGRVMTAGTEYGGVGADGSTSLDVRHEQRA